MLQCPPDCPNIKGIKFDQDLMSRKKSTFCCEKYSQRLWFLDDTSDLERLECCEMLFKKMIVYECYFTFGTRMLKVSTPDGLLELSNGFWINEDFYFTKKSDALIWIPPSKIHYIKKVESEVLDEEG